jgi:hypothetical protein
MPQNSERMFREKLTNVTIVTDERFSFVGDLNFLFRVLYTKQYDKEVFGQKYEIDFNVYVYAVRGIGGLKNEAQRNVKPDHLQTVPRYRTKLRKYF